MSFEKLKQIFSAVVLARAVVFLIIASLLSTCYLFEFKVPSHRVLLLLVLWWCVEVSEAQPWVLCACHCYSGVGLSVLAAAEWV